MRICKQEASGIAASVTPVPLVQQEGGGWHSKCRRDAPELVRVDIITQFNPSDFCASQSAGQCKILDAVSNRFSTSPNSITDINVASLRHRRTCIVR
ncbi:hypothetical protein EV184_12950 [Sinorhizobium americanum]|uniref:Uncharacterized protein n=1 Tax=Sinorhizobium americanum TaxID=194963 RepID=A0A4R2B0H2_9HYPH|nr:hypothetical protein EV184_12950 [Sinorhizobium americanum]